MTYRGELRRAMQMLAEHPRSVFIGQAVAVPGTAMSSTFEGVPREKLLELPVFEDTQLGMAIGMSLRGDLPVCVYPRWNFLLLAMNQLVLHLDKLPLYSEYRPKVIIRTAVATDEPMDPGLQHLGDYSDAVQSMLDTVKVVRIGETQEIVPEYQRALESPGSTVLVEYSENYA